MRSELADLLDILLSEFGGESFSFEDALDYVDYGEAHLVQELIDLGYLEFAGKEGFFRIKDYEKYFEGNLEPEEEPEG